VSALAAAAVVLALSVGPAAASPDWAALGLVPYETPRPAPELGLPDLDGRLHTVADLRDKVALLFFWTTW
jgi:hypothetical protein